MQECREQGTQKLGQPAPEQAEVIAGGGKHGVGAIAFASQPDRMAEQTKYIAYGPARTDAIPLVEPVMLEHLPTAPESSKNGLTVNAQFWGDYGEQLRTRFTRWIAQ